MRREKRSAKTEIIRKTYHLALRAAVDFCSVVYGLLAIEKSNVRSLWIILLSHDGGWVCNNEKNRFVLFKYMKFRDDHLVKMKNTDLVLNFVSHNSHKFCFTQFSP